MSRWDRFWFAPAPPTNLGASRVAFFGALLVWAWARDFSNSPLESSPRWSPIPFFFFHPPLVSIGALNALQVAWVLALLLSAVGLFTRPATAFAFALTAYLTWVPLNFGHVGHGTQLLVLITGVMALSRAGDAVSLDARLRRRAAAEPSGEYTWPVKLVCVLVSAVYFAAAVSKLRHSGLTWVTSDYLARLLLHLRELMKPELPSVAVWVAHHEWLAHLLAAGTLAVEACYPLALLSPRLRLPLVASAIAMHVAIELLLGISFRTFIFCSVFWVPWDRLITTRATTPTPPAARPARRAASAPAASAGAG